MDLTREEAINNFREMWEWIADKTLARGHKVYEHEFFNENGISKVRSDCFLCEYRSSFFDISCSLCSQCPIDFHGDKCHNQNSPYTQWCSTSYYEHYEAAYYAREIAKLPEKESALFSKNEKERITFERLKQLAKADAERRIIVLPYNDDMANDAEANRMKALKCLAKQNIYDQCYRNHENMKRYGTDAQEIVCSDNSVEGEKCPFFQSTYGIHLKNEERHE